MLGFDVEFAPRNIEVNSSKIPLFNEISCGTGMFVDDSIEDYIAIPDRLTKKDKAYFANVAHGDSMIGKGINDGDILIFERTNILNNGDIGSLCIGEDKAVCKVYRKISGGYVILESANDKYEPIMIDILKSDCFRIIGRLVAVFKRY